jgi:hypothetical protein
MHSMREENVPQLLSEAHQGTYTDDPESQRVVRLAEKQCI